MSYQLLTYGHLATVLPALVLGTLLLVRRKGTQRHRQLGKIYMLLMLATALITLLMPATFGTRLFNHFGWLHLFSLSVFYTVPAAYFAARRGDVASHKGNMIGLYVGGLVIAGSLALLPGRFLHQVLFG